MATLGIEQRPGVECGACGKWASELAGRVNFYLRDDQVERSVWKCNECGTYIQDADFDDPIIRGHFDVASYTSLHELERWRPLRAGLFQHILDLAREHLGRELTGVHTVDFGIAYGIMLDMLRDAGAIAEGVETVEALRRSVRARGFVVHEDVYTLPRDSYGLVTAIDSFYYINNPARALSSVRESLKTDGILIMRLANRTPYFNIRRRLGMQIPQKRFGDLKYFYSPNGVERLLSRTGFRIECIDWTDKGRRDPRFWESIYYTLSPIANRVSPVKISPGMFIVARPATRD
jgi:SAM-dependent methyltransferase